MSNITYPELYQRFGIRSTSGLTVPRLFNLENFKLPRGAIVHYLPQSVSDLGPDDQFFPILEERMRPYVDQVTDMTSFEGAPRRRGAFNVENLKRMWLIRNRRYRRVSNLQRALEDKQTAIVSNYALIPMQWRYQPVPMARWFRFQNLMKTFADRVNYFGQQSARQQFLFINLPDVLPSRQFLNVSVESEEVVNVDYIARLAKMQERRDPLRIEVKTMAGYYNSVMPGIYDGQPDATSLESFDETSLGWSEDLSFESFDESSLSMGDESLVSNEAMNRIRLGYFQDDTALFFSDLWKWMSDNRAESILGSIDNDSINKLNLVVMRNGKFSLLSFAKLNGWVKSEDNERGNGFGSMSMTMDKYLQGIVQLTSVSDKITVEETVDEEGNSEVVDINTPEPQPNEPVIDVTVGDKGESDISRLRNAAKKVTQAPREILATKRNETTLPTKEVKGTSAFVPEEVAKVVPKPTPGKPEEAIIDTSDPRIRPVEVRSRDLLSKGLISGNEFKRHVRLANSFKTIPAPFGEGTLEDFVKIPKEEVWNFKPKVIPDIPHVVDKSMLQSTLLNYDSDYIEKIFQKDVASMILNLQKAGLAITDYSVVKKSDALNDLYDYTVRIVPVYGSPSTVRFQLPAVDKNGKYRVNGTKYFMRKLKFDKPIRKIAPNVVALSTYYGKLFVERSARSADDMGSALTSLIEKATQLSPPAVLELVLGNTFAEDQPVPRAFSAIAKEYVSFIINGIQFVFDYPGLVKNFGEQVVAEAKSKGLIPVGSNKTGVFYMNIRGEVYDSKGQSLGSINSMLGLSDDKLPVEQVIVKVMGQEVPMAAILMYQMGINKLMNLLDVKPERRVKGTRVDPVPNTFELTFADEVWRFPVHGGNSSLIWASLLRWKKYLRGFSVQELDNKDTYNLLFGMADLTARYVREIDNLNALFLDPVAIEVLTEMKEPTELNELFIKAAFYLVTDNYPSDISSEGALIRGYERMPGAVYRALTGAIRQYSGQPVSSRATVDISPYEVLSAIQSDPSVAIVEDSNPIHNLKEKENVTYAGTGGRSKRAMVRRTRAFHVSDIGIRAEASVDNGDVGINTFLTANPNLTSLRGTAVPTKDPDPKNGVGNLLSTSALVAPFATYDDPKRVSFIGIQQSHVIASNDAMVSPIRTGYEQIMAHRVDDLFATAAKGPGVITEKGPNYMVVKYDDESLGEDRIQLGRRFGVVTGHVVPHQVKSELEVGKRVVEGEIVSYHPGFFQRDWRDPTQVLWKSGTLTNIALMENNSTFEDASLISENLSKRLHTPTSHTRTILINFNQGIRNLVQVGEHVDNESILAFIEDEVSAASDLFDESTLEALKRLGSPAPRAKYVGNIEKVEVVYFGDKEDMSPSIRKVADYYDNQRAKLSKALGGAESKSGQIFTPTRLDGLSIELDMMAIRIYITHDRSMGDGDKIVVGNQKKSVVSGVFTGKCRTVGPVIPGDKPWDVDLQFSYKSVNARIVNSAMMSGMVNILLQHIATQMLLAYNEE